jgi:hypothetical protein
MKPGKGLGRGFNCVVSTTYPNGSSILFGVKTANFAQKNSKNPFD